MMYSGRLVGVVGPIVLISIGYIDPGKWVSCIDSGARFGGDLMTYLVLFNFVGAFCYYLSAHIGFVTGNSLAQICSKEYDRLTCIFLGVQAELSVICLDLTMILGIAHGLNTIFGADLFTCALLTALNVLLYPLFSAVVDSSKMKFLVVCMAGLTLVCYVLGMLISLPEFPISSYGFVLKPSGESAFALMSLLGANVMPHNFYLSSSIVQRYRASASPLTRVWTHDYIIGTLIISSGIVLANHVLMSLGANAFYSADLGLVTFQESMALLDQAFRNGVIPVASFLILFVANQITALSWEFCAEGGETVLNDLFSMDLPEWLHRATVRIFSVVLALCCIWLSGAEGIYNMLMCTQVMVALLLPSSMLLLYRIASSTPIMGLMKISFVLEFIVILTFMGTLGLEIIFVMEMLFGESDWVSNLRWNLSDSTSFAYVFLLTTACVSLGFMIRLAIIPLKSHNLDRDALQVAPKSLIERKENDVLETGSYVEKSLPSQDKTFSIHPAISTRNHDINLPETIMDSIQELSMANIEENSAPINVSSATSFRCHPDPEQSIAPVESIPVSSVLSGDPEVQLLTSRPMNCDANDSDSVEKTLRIEGESLMGKDDEDGADPWETEDSCKDVPGVGTFATPEGPGSFRSLSGKSDEGGTGAGSLSRLSGLGRGARRQLAAALDEFWGQLYDFHGQITQEAKEKKLDQLFCLESKLSQPLTNNTDSTGNEFGTQFQSLGDTVSDNSFNYSFYNTKNGSSLQSSIESAYRAQIGSRSIWSDEMQMFDKYVQSSNRTAFDPDERRYQSMRVSQSSVGSENQPATVHGYQFATFLNQLGKERMNYANGQLESVPQNSPSLISNSYQDSMAFAFGQNYVNGFNSAQPSSFQNLAVQRNSTLQSDKPYYNNLSSVGPVGVIASQENSKKYHSLPAISGLAVPLRNQYVSNIDTQWDSPNRPAGFRTSVGRATCEPTNPGSGSRDMGVPMVFDQITPSREYSAKLSSGYDTGSLWSKQPYEQFGVANKVIKPGVGIAGSKSNLSFQEPVSLAERESKLLQSLRLCILKLLKLEGSEWLFRSNDGADEDLIDRVATRERLFYEAESQDIKQGAHLGEAQHSFSEKKYGTPIKGDEATLAKLVSSVPHCGEGCVWKVDLIVSFGVWSVHRVLELSLMESRPELWGKYTYVLNRLQGVIDPAFFKPRTPMSPCFCLPVSYQMRSSPPVGNGLLPPMSRPAKGKVTTASMLLDMIKVVEMSISNKKGRSGTAAGDVAFPKGKENLASVLKRYKRRLANKSVNTQDNGPGSRKLQNLSSYVSS